MKKIKGFTLVELMAVVIILGIVALVTTPVMNKLMGGAKRDMLARTAEGLESSAKAYYANIMVDDPGTQMTTKTFVIGENITELGFKGELPDSGLIIINEVGNVAFAFKEGEYCAKKEFSDNELVVTKSSECSLSSTDID